MLLQQCQETVCIPVFVTMNAIKRCVKQLKVNKYDGWRSLSSRRLVSMNNRMRYTPLTMLRLMDRPED
jgi:hypothetical protein